MGSPPQRTLTEESRAGGRLLPCRLGAGCGERDGIACADVHRGDLARRLQHRIGDRADVRVDSLEITQHVEVERGRLLRLRLAFAQSYEVPLRRRELGVA